MSFNVLKELQWAAYVRPAADVREDHHLGARLRGEQAFSVFLNKENV